jgi:SAM-dependent methyltransferase
MGNETDAQAIYTARKREYSRFIRAVLYPQGLRAFFRSCDLRSGLRVLDAGCGTGALTFALLAALGDRGFEPAAVDGFDLTPAMLDDFRARIAERRLERIRLTRANVLELERLPDDWHDYDLVVSSAMLEYLPPNRLAVALAALRERMRPDGRMFVFISRRNPAMKWLIRKWWKAHLYTRRDLSAAFVEAGLAPAFRPFPFPYTHLNVWGLIVEAHTTNRAGGAHNPSAR